MDFEQEIEIGDLRGLEEDERIIIVPPKEESTVEGKSKNSFFSPRNNDDSLFQENGLTSLTKLYISASHILGIYQCNHYFRGQLLGHRAWTVQDKQEPLTFLEIES